MASWSRSSTKRCAAAACPPDLGSPQAFEVLRQGLHSWYAVNRRDLPWRRVSDPYSIWVAEVMLQQTTVTTATPYWRRFLAALPDLEALARAPVARVLSLWSGLGYYQRARNLHRAARSLIGSGARSLPATIEELRALPGIGAYTAAAVASIAFGVPAPVVDGNVRRVLSRLAGLGGDVRRGAAARRIDALAAALLDPSAPADSNQALMELGATVCTPRRPRCGACPWSPSCAARRSGDPERYPARQPRRLTILVQRGAVRIADRRGRWLFLQAPPGAINAGLWEFPAVELSRPSHTGAPLPLWSPRAARKLRALLAEQRGLDVRVGRLIARARHTITHHRIVVFLAEAELNQTAPRGPGWRWLAPARAGDGALTGETRKLLARATP